MSVIEERLIGFTLLAGKHNANEQQQWCLLEAVAWVAGEPWSDHPECVDPVLAAFGRAWNDALPDQDRTRLLAPFIPQLVGTRSTPDVQDTRAFMAADWAVRVYTPTWLTLAKLEDHAHALSELGELVSVESCESAMTRIAAAGVAARVAARAALRPTVIKLQASALDLYARMIAVGR